MKHSRERFGGERGGGSRAEPGRGLFKEAISSTGSSRLRSTSLIVMPFNFNLSDFVSLSPCLSLMPITMVSVVPRGTIPLTGFAHGPFPCWISIQQSTLSPAIITSCTSHPPRPHQSPPSCCLPRKFNSTTSRSDTRIGGFVIPFS